MAQDRPETKKHKRKDRVLGDEWLEWEEGEGIRNINEGKRTFLLISLAVLTLIIAILFLLLYLILPRFEMFGRIWVLILLILTTGSALFLLAWYLLLIMAVYLKNNYFNICLSRGNKLFFFLLPCVQRLASRLGISRDRLSHSFIKVSNDLVGVDNVQGKVLALLPRCLNKTTRKAISDICSRFPNVESHTAPGGEVARRIVNKTEPNAIVAIACERDLLSGIRDIAPRIPVIGISNIRPSGPCKDTTVDVDEFKAALEKFCGGD